MSTNDRTQRTNAGVSVSVQMKFDTFCFIICAYGADKRFRFVERRVMSVPLSAVWSLVWRESGRSSLHVTVQQRVCSHAVSHRIVFNGAFRTSSALRFTLSRSASHTRPPTRSHQPPPYPDLLMTSHRLTARPELVEMFTAHARVIAFRPDARMPGKMPSCKRSDWAIFCLAFWLTA